MKRPLSAPEIFIWAGGQIARNFALSARIRGNFSLEQLWTALEKVRQKDPLIAGRIILQDGVPWYDTEDVPEIPIRMAAGDWVGEVAEELTRLFPTSTGPLVRFVVVPAGDSTDLIIVCHHCMADGLSAGYLLKDVLHFMAFPNALVDPLPLLPPFEDLLPVVDPSHIQFPNMMPPPMMNETAVPGEGNPIYILHWSLPPDQTDDFATRCRQEGTSVHAALCTAFLMAFNRLGLSDPAIACCVSSPISIRNRLRHPVGEHFGLFIHPGIKTSLEDGHASRDFWSQARAMKAAFDDKVRDEGLWTLFFLCQEMLQNMPLEQALRFNELPVDYELSITNLGRLDIPTEYGSFCLEAVYGPLVNSMESEKILGVTTTAGRMTFTFVARHRLMDVVTAQRWQEAAMQQLTDVMC